MSKIVLNLVEPGSSTPIDPVVPNTGLFTSTHGGGGVDTIIIVTSIVVILAIVAAIILHYKKKHNKTVQTAANTRLAGIFSTIKSKKKVSIPLAVLAMIVSLGTLAALLVNAGKSNTNAAEGGLTVTTTGEEKTIEVGDSPVFAVAEVEVTVAEETQAGYTLTAFTDSTDLVSTTDGTNIISMVAADEGELIALAEDTYGLSLTKPASQDDETFTALSTDADAPTVLKTIDDYSPTEAEDKTTIYYGFYITPDTPYGTYEGSEINYVAEANRADLATVTFNGNGLTFDGAETNTVKYITNVSMGDEAYSHTPNVNDEGEQVGGMYPIGLNNTFVYRFDNAAEVKLHLVRMEADGTCSENPDQYFSFWAGNHPNYTAVNNWETGEKVSGSNGKYIFADGSQYAGMDATVSGNTLTLAYTTSDHRGSYCGNSGYGFYAIITATDADGNSVSLLGNELYKGSYETPSSEAATKLLGWSTDKDATAPMYGNEKDIALGLSLAAGDEVTLYAVYEPTFAISYNGNGADSATDMNDVTQYSTVTEPTGKSVDLLASNFTKEGYGFVGWSTDSNAWDNLVDADSTNDPTIYGPNQTITINEDLIAEAGENRKLVLNAVWAPAETTASGDPVSLQGWQGCSNLTATTYDNTTGTLNVGKNTIIALTDNRDGNIYTVARLADGNCWMTENLRLDNSTANESTTSEFTTANTNNPSLPLTNNYAEQTTSNRLSVSSNNWCTDGDSAPCYNQSIINTDNITNPATSPSFNQDFTGAAHEDFSASINSYSTYYNWYSATAGNGKQETSSNVTVAGDVCPAGWHLPYGGSQTSEKGGNTSGGFYYLNQQMGGNTSATGSNNWRSFPNNFVYSGYWYGSSADNRGNYGDYWSSTAGDTYSAYGLYFRSGSVYPGTNGSNKGYGYSVRCMAPVE